MNKGYYNIILSYGYVFHILINKNWIIASKISVQESCNQKDWYN